MSATPPTPKSRPRAVNVAFWCWIAADVLIAAAGLFLISLPTILIIRGAGGLLLAVGLAHGFLVGRARRGNQRFAFAAVGLAIAIIVLLALLLLLYGVPGVLVAASIMALMITGSALMQGKPAQAWFDGEGAS